MIRREYKHVQTVGSLNAPDQTIYEIINKEALEGNWKVHTIDFAFDRALLVRRICVENDETIVCWDDGVCTCWDKDIK